MFEYTNSSHHSTYILVSSTLIEAGCIIRWNLFRSGQTRLERVESSRSKSYPIRSYLKMPTWVPSNSINPNRWSGQAALVNLREGRNLMSKTSTASVHPEGAVHYTLDGADRVGDSNEIYVTWLPRKNTAAVVPNQVAKLRFSTVFFWFFSTSAGGRPQNAAHLRGLRPHICGG